MARILVVDDEALDRMILESILTQLDHEPVLAESAEIALDLYDPKTFDLVMTDLVLPELNGLQLIGKLLARHPDASIVAVSGRCIDQLRTARKIGAVGTLTKPLNFTRVQALVTRATTENKPGRAVAVA